MKKWVWQAGQRTWKREKGEIHVVGRDFELEEGESYVEVFGFNVSLILFGFEDAFAKESGALDLGNLMPSAHVGSDRLKGLQNLAEGADHEHFQFIIADPGLDGLLDVERDPVGLVLFAQIQHPLQVHLTQQGHYGIGHRGRGHPGDGAEGVERLRLPRRRRLLLNRDHQIFQVHFKTTAWLLLRRRLLLDRDHQIFQVHFEITAWWVGLFVWTTAYVHATSFVSGTLVIIIFGIF